MDGTRDREFSPPYNVPWSTFINIVEKVAADNPNRIDRTYLSSRSGSEQSYLLSAFRNFGLIDESQYVTDRLRALMSTSDRPACIRELLEQHYPKAIELGRTNATPGELDAVFAEMFPNVSGASRVKAIRFFLHAAEYAGVQRSPLWKAPKAGTTGGRRSGSRGRRGSTPDTASGDNGSAPKGNMKQAYFDLLLKKAEAQEDLDSDLLDRIERLLGESKD
jgi:hypothetical protein